VLFFRLKYTARQKSIANIDIYCFISNVIQCKEYTQYFGYCWKKNTIFIPNISNINHRIPLQNDLFLASIIHQIQTTIIDITDKNSHTG
jgi:hypothetical protein